VGIVRRGIGIISASLLLASCTDPGPANNYETVQQIADQIAAETPWACGDLRVSGPNDPLDPISFAEVADCGEVVALYIHRTQQETQKVLDFASEYAPHYRVVYGTTWSVICFDDPADLICSELHKALGGDIREPTPIRP